MTNREQIMPKGSERLADMVGAKYMGVRTPGNSTTGCALRLSRGVRQRRVCPLRVDQVLPDWMGRPKPRPPSGRAIKEVGSFGPVGRQGRPETASAP